MLTSGMEMLLLKKMSQIQETRKEFPWLDGRWWLKNYLAKAYVEQGLRHSPFFC